MICGDNEAICVGTGGDAPDQVNNLRYCFTTGNKDLILGIRLVASCVNLIVVNIDHLFTGKDTAQLRNFQRLDAIKLHTNCVCVVLLQDGFPL